MKKDFPLLSNSNLSYLDSAATTQKPQVVIDRMAQFYNNENANIHRGLYKLSAEATEAYENARKNVAQFIGAKTEEIVFTSGTTQGINMLSRILPDTFGDRKEIVLSELEHHANLIPWQEVARKKGYTLKFIPVLPNGELDYPSIGEIITEKTALVSITHMSNALGTRVDVRRICKFARKVGALSIVDAAQSIVHENIDVADIGCDFLVFSGHKLYGPTGTGVLFGRQELLDTLKPANYGGDIVTDVTFESAEYQEAPHRFETGTPNIAGVIGLDAAITYVCNEREQGSAHHEHEVFEYLSHALSNHPSVKVHSPPSANAIISFSLKGVHTHDVADILGEHGVCIRAGYHCAIPLLKKLGLPGVCRASIAMYNTKEDVDQLMSGINKVYGVFK